MHYPSKPQNYPPRYGFAMFLPTNFPEEPKMEGIMASGSGESTNIGAVFGWLGAIAGAIVGFGKSGWVGALLGALVGGSLGYLAFRILRLAWALLIGAIILALLFFLFSSRLCSFFPEYCPEQPLPMKTILSSKFLGSESDPWRVPDSMYVARLSNFGKGIFLSKVGSHHGQRLSQEAFDSAKSSRLQNNSNENNATPSQSIAPFEHKKIMAVHCCGMT